MKLENIGAIKQLTLPDNWHERKSAASIGVRWEKTFSPNVAPNVELTISYRGVPLDEASRKVFSFLLKQGEKDSFSVEEIKALRTVMGFATTGDNQHTNSAPPDSMEGPGLDLQSVTVRRVGGKLVLGVEGKFKQNNRIYTGIFYQPGSEGKMVEEFYLQAPNPEDYEKYKPTYEEIVNSISWR